MLCTWTLAIQEAEVENHFRPRDQDWKGSRVILHLKERGVESSGTKICLSPVVRIKRKRPSPMPGRECLLSVIMDN